MIARVEPHHLAVAEPLPAPISASMSINVSDAQNFALSADGRFFHVRLVWL